MHGALFGMIDSGNYLGQHTASVEPESEINETVQAAENSQTGHSVAPIVRSSANSRWPLFLVVVAIIVGAALRLSFPNDIEYKFDEAYMFQESQAVGVQAPWPVVGMVSSTGLRNPGFSVWFFVFLARLFHAQDPITLSQAVQWLNVAALVLLFFAIHKLLAKDENRKPWMWTVALAAVNPLAVLYSRKIWAQDTLSFFCVALLAGWFKRGTFFGAFIWGLFGALVGQIHMTGFFLCISLLIGTVTLARRFDLRQKLIGGGGFPEALWEHFLYFRGWNTLAPTRALCAVLIGKTFFRLDTGVIGFAIHWAMVWTTTWERTMASLRNNPSCARFLC